MQPAWLAHLSCRRGVIVSSVNPGYSIRVFWIIVILSIIEFWLRISTWNFCRFFSRAYWTNQNFPSFTMVSPFSPRCVATNTQSNRTELSYPLWKLDLKIIIVSSSSLRYCRYYYQKDLIYYITRTAKFQTPKNECGTWNDIERLDS